MFSDGLFLERNQIASVGLPVDLSVASGSVVTGDWINVSYCHRFAVLFHKNIGTAGDDPTLTIQQATDSAGTGAKALNFTKIYRRETATAGGLKTAAGLGQWTITTQTAANTYTNLTSAESELMWVVDFQDAMLDVDGGFKFVNATVADVGTNAQLGGVLMFLYDIRDATVASSMADVRS